MNQPEVAFLRPGPIEAEAIPAGRVNAADPPSCPQAAVHQECLSTTRTKAG